MIAISSSRHVCGVVPTATEVRSDLTILTNRFVLSSSSPEMSSFEFSQWPPQFNDIQLATLIHDATTYSLAHGLAYLPPAPSQPPSPSSVIHAPISLLPAPVPRSLFHKAQKLQSIYNDLYARIAVDDDFLDQVMGAEVGVGQADEFVRRLWTGWKEIMEEGIVQVNFWLGCT